jgi:hypothetical protein
MGDQGSIPRKYINFSVYRISHTMILPASYSMCTWGPCTYRCWSIKLFVFYVYLGPLYVQMLEHKPYYSSLNSV